MILSISLKRVWVTKPINSKKPAGPERTLVVVRGKNWPKPLVLLASRRLTGRKEVVGAFNNYCKRWKAEEATRAKKESRGWGVRLEDVRALTRRGIRRVVLLASIFYGFMAELRDRVAAVAEDLAQVVNSFGKLPPDPRYRIFRGLGVMLGRIARWRVRRWRGKS